MKPFLRANPERVVTVTIEEDGDMTFLATDSADVFLECGEVKTRRASHVEPVNFFLRVAFYILRWFGDKNQIADWTRGWRTVWRVNLHPVHGPILPERFTDRKQAIVREVEFLNDWFLRR